MDGTDRLTEHRIDVGEVHLNVALCGRGRPVLLLHGFPDSWRLWRHQIAALADAGHRVIAPDLRGFGGSDRPEGVAAYGMGHLLRDITCLLDRLDVARADVVGHDWGAALAWALAERTADRVRSLTVVSVGHGRAIAAAGPAQWRRSWYMLWFLLPGVAERVLPADDWAFFRDWAWEGAEPGAEPDADRQIADLSRPGALTAGLNWYRANIDPARFVRRAAADRRRTVTCPTLGVWSSDDPFLTEAQMAGSSECVAGPWRYERIEGVDHWVPVHAPERLTALLLEFLAPE